MFKYKGIKFDTLFDVKSRKVALFFKDVCPKEWDAFVATVNQSHLWVKNGGDLELWDISPDADFEKIIDDLIDDLSKFEYEQVCYMPIKVNMELYHYISSQKRNDESFEKCIIRLLKAFPVSDFEKGQFRRNVVISPDAVSFIKEYAITEGETVETILTRLFLKK